MKTYSVDIKVGDKIQVGRFKNVKAVIKNITIDEHGQPVIHTNKGEKKLFSCRIHKLTPGTRTPKQILLEVKNRKKSWFFIEEAI